MSFISTNKEVLEDMSTPEKKRKSKQKLTTKGKNAGDVQIKLLNQCNTIKTELCKKLYLLCLD